MEILLTIFVGSLLFLIGAVLVASFVSRARNRQAADLAAGSNKPERGGRGDPAQS
jgi:hypothetical protein